jgi:nucleotide-binding universal stress UspA family protein
MCIHAFVYHLGKFAMFKKILVPTDGSALSEKSAKAAIQFAAANHASLVTIAIVHPISALSLSDAIGDDVLEDVENLQDELLRNNAEKIKALANKAEVRCDIVISRADHAYEEILATAQKKRCDLIWMASRSRTSLQKLLIGSQTQRVLSHSAIPVLVWQKNSWE